MFQIFAAFIAPDDIGTPAVVIKKICLNYPKTWAACLFEFISLGLR
jgi:hypothetical protein